MMHPSSVNLVTMPCIAMAEVEVIYHGQSAHAAAMPERGVNALDALVLAYQGIAALRQHIRATERIHGIITDGGQAPNVVPERAAGRFYVRAANARGARAAEAPRRGLLPRGRRGDGRRGRDPLGPRRLPRHPLQRAARLGLPQQRRAPRARLLPVREAPGQHPGQHRHGQREPARAVDPSDARGRAAALHDPQPRVREVGGLGAGRRRGASTAPRRSR